MNKGMSEKKGECRNNTLGQGRYTGVHLPYNAYILVCFTCTGMSFDCFLLIVGFLLYNETCFIFATASWFSRSCLFYHWIYTIMVITQRKTRHKRNFFKFYYRRGRKTWNRVPRSFTASASKRPSRPFVNVIVASPAWIAPLCNFLCISCTLQTPLCLNSVFYSELDCWGCKYITLKKMNVSFI